MQPAAVQDWPLRNGSAAVREFAAFQGGAHADRAADPARSIGGDFYPQQFFDEGD